MAALLGRGVYYGWVLVAALAVTETISFGVLSYAFTVFVKPMQEELGWSRATISGAFSMAALVSGLAGLAVGRWLDRHGPRALMTVGSIVATLGVLAWSAVNDVGQFYALWLVLGIAMAAVLYDPAFAVVATWFVARRGRALTLLTFIAGFASVIFVPLAGWLVEVQGWRLALVTLAAILGVGTIALHGLLLRRRPEDLGLLPDGEISPRRRSDRSKGHQVDITLRSALEGAAFWWLTLAFFLSTLTSGAIFVHLVPYLTDLGFDPAFAALVTGAIGLMALPGRLVFTPLGDRIPRTAVTAFLFLLQTVSLVVLLVAEGNVGVSGFVILFGAGFGAITPARAALVADLYGRGYYARISSVMVLFMALARAVAPVAAGLSYDLLHSYVPMFWVLAALSGLGALAVLLARPAGSSEAAG